MSDIAVESVRFVNYELIGEHLRVKQYVSVERTMWSIDFTDLSGLNPILCHPRKAEIDTGASVCVMGRALAEQLLLSPHAVRLLSPCVKLTMADSAPVSPCYEIMVPVTGYTNANEKLAVVSCLLPEVDDVILGRDAVAAFGLQPVFKFPNDE
jgi:hypothetical protein